MKQKLLKSFTQSKTFVWSRPWGFAPEHELVVSLLCEELLNDMLPAVRRRHLKWLERGHIPGAYCRRCGMTAKDLQRWPSAVCRANPDVVAVRREATHADVPRALGDLIAKQK